MRLLKQRERFNQREIPVIFYALSAEHEQGAVLEMEYLANPWGALSWHRPLTSLVCE